MNATGRDSAGKDSEAGQIRAPGQGIAKAVVSLLLLTGLATWGGDALALAKFSRVSAGWSTASTWSTAGCGGAANTVAPTAADDVTICTGHAITTNANSSALSLVIQTGGTLTQATNRTLTIGAGGLNVAGTLTSRNTLTVNGATSVSGTLAITTTTGTKTFVGAVTVNAGGVWNNSGNEAVTLRGGLTHNGATFTAGTGIYTFSTTAAQALNCMTALAIPRLTVIAPTVLTNNCPSLTIATALAGTGNLTNSATSTLNIGGTSAITTLNAATVGSTVNYTGAAQTAKVTIYDNLTLSGSLAKTFATTPTVNGVLSLEGTATVVVTGAGVVTYGPAATLQYNKLAAYTTTLEEWPATFVATGGVIIANTGAITLNAAKVLNASVPLTINSGATLANGAFALSVAGNFTQNGTFTAGAGVFTLNGGAAVQTLSGTGPLGFANLTVNNTGGITLARNVTVTSAIIGAVTLTDTCPMDYTLTSNGGATVAHSCSQPVVTSINLASANPTVAASVDWTVTFTQSVTGVSTSNFTLVNGGLGGAPAITLVSGSGTTWTVTASTGTGTGTLGLNMTNVTGISPAVITPMPFTGQVYSVRPPAPVIYYHDTTAGVNIGFDGPTNVTGANQIIPPIITASLNPVSTCPVTSARSASHPVGLYTHSRWYLNANYAVATNIGANPTGSASLRGVAVTDTVVVSLYDYDPVLGGKTLIGSSTPITLTGGGATTTYLYTITSPLYTVPTGHRLMLEYNFNQPLGTNNARVYCSAIASFISVTETPVPIVPVAEYRMDEASWNGTANEVVDSSVNALHGSALLGATPATAKICNGANLLANYVEVPDNVLLDIPTALTVTAWIKPARWGGAPGDALMTFLSKDDNYEAHITSAGQINWWWGTGNITSAATAPIGAWTHVAMVYASGSQTLYVNGVSSATGTVAGALPVNAMPFQIGNDQEFGGGTRRFDGMIDEVKIFNVALTPAQISAGYANENAGNNWDGTARVCPTYAPDHLEIQSSGSGLTCAASTLTIKACVDAAIPCAIPYTLGVSGTLGATGTPTVNWDDTTGGAAGAGFAIPSGSSSVTKDVQVATAGSVVFGITSPAPVPTNATVCNFGAPACTFTADTAGFVFSDTTTGSAYTIPAQVSGIATPTLYLRALQAATNNPAVCTPAIIGQTTAVNMGYVCNNPAACQAGNLATINATAVAPGGTAVSLTFDANGSAPITARYDDVGQITLNANKTVTPFGGATAVTLNGSSNAFVVKPDHFDLSGIQQTAAPNLANPAAADATGAKFVKAGEQFSVTVTAKNALGATTANYGQESTAESVKLTSALVAGLGLTGNPAVGGTFGAFTNGVATGTAFTWSEAGIITLTPSVADADYLGAGDATGTTSGNVGRFYAAQLALSGGVIANRTGLAGCPAPAGCGTFTYMGEQMSAVFNLTAKAVDGTTTLQNYNYSATPANNFAKLDPTATGNPLVLAAVDTGTPRTVATLDTTTYGVAGGSFAGGVATVTVPFAVTRGGSAYGPFDALDVGVNPADGDGAALAVLDLAVNAGGAPNTHGLVASTKARYGRMKLSNAHGSELLPLAINVAAQYWNGTTYVTNILDNDSVFAATDVVFGNYTKNLNAANYPNSGATVVTPVSVVFVNGAASYKLAKPGAGNNGSVDMTVSALSAYLPSNTARATFGVYKGNNEFIYLREAY